MQVPLLELTLAEEEVTRGDLVTEGLTDLADTKRNLHARGLDNIVKVEVDVLASFTAQVGLHALALDNTKIGLHQEVKPARLCEFTAAYGALVLYDIFFWQLIDAEPPLAILTIHQAIYKVFYVPAGLPYFWMGNNRAFDPHHIVVHLHH